ncbi:hypothetical protein CHARACLAT_027012 [Characodon lateralis]|uniref:Uncharacterized protein n=1 Tax=Characodon lateralis TaxID=208331 RepID=A0ABU7DKM2_9TELE|nr:hypothetical protein [Characodon lateralis]
MKPTCWILDMSEEELARKRKKKLQITFRVWRMITPPTLTGSSSSFFSEVIADGHTWSLQNGKLFFLEELTLVVSSVQRTSSCEPLPTSRSAHQELNSIPGTLLGLDEQTCFNGAAGTSVIFPLELLRCSPRDSAAAPHTSAFL